VISFDLSYDVITKFEINNCLSKFINMYIRFVLLRFAFYVEIVNFSLETLFEIVKTEGTIFKFGGKRIESQDFGVFQSFGRLREIYKTIKEMEEIVNQTMGFLMLVQIVTVSLEMINFGSSLDLSQWNQRSFWRK
jgi:hypothetical protein